jgi:hypothetical protein
VRNRFPPPIPQKQLEVVLQAEWYKFPSETVKKLYESIARSVAAVLEAKVVQRHINKEMCTICCFSIILSNPVGKLSPLLCNLPNAGSEMTSKTGCDKYAA